ncbi:MAG: hypothetical protein M3Y50_01580 [Acidobacteriota bacterium]|nr:hypothetical protein [Acidobacteriota bacterium]
MRLAVWAAAGSLLVASTFLIDFIPFAPAGGSGLVATLWIRRWMILSIFIPFFSGMAITFRAERQLRSGINNELWSDAELAPLRKLLRSPYWKWLAAADFGTYLALIVSNHHRAVTFFSVLWPFQVLLSLSNIVTPRTSYSGLGVQIDWAKSAPVRSEHWGETRPDPSAM